ncbi:MAG: hypothetical protein Q4F39_06295 [Bacteroidia bacterium]|nr:hypothetical protein [Bacteroidia bacterium]
MKTKLFFLALACLMFGAVSCNKQDSSQKTFGLIIGTNSAYWDKVRLGAMEEGRNLGYNVVVYNYPSDLAYDEIAAYIRSLNDYKGLVGVAGLANEETLDAAYGSLRDDISIVVAEGVFVEDGAVSKRYRGTVALDYDDYATAFTNKIPESKLVVISYDKGANAEIAAVIKKNKGADNVVVCPVGDQRDVPAILGEALEKHPETEAVIFCSSNFVSDSNIGLCGTCMVYSSDLNAAVAPAIRDGRISLNISIDNYEFGANMVRALADVEAHKDSKSIVKYDIPFLFTDKQNIDSQDRKRLYE